MMRDETSALHLQVPAVRPEPVPGCASCEALARARTAAKRRGDYSRVGDCNVLLRVHPNHVPLPPRLRGRS